MEAEADAMEGEMDPMDDEEEAQEMIKRRAFNNQKRQKKRVTRKKKVKATAQAQMPVRESPYSYLKALPMSLVEKKEHEYHNTQSDKIRRDENWKSAVVLN